MKELTVGTRVVFMYNGVAKKGGVNHVYEDLDVVLIQVPEESAVYKVDLSDVEILSEPNDQEPDEKFITITHTEFKSIATELIKLLPDPDLQMILTLFSNMLSREIFGQLPQND